MPRWLRTQRSVRTILDDATHLLSVLAIISTHAVKL